MIRYFLRVNGESASEPGRRSDLLERLLARAEVRELADWRRAAFAVLSDDPMPAVAPVSLGARARGSDVPGVAQFPWVWLATPVHLEPGLDNVRLPSNGIVPLASAEAQQLAQDFNRLWADAPLRLQALGETLYLLSAQAWPAMTHDPESFLGEHIDEYLPEGAGAARLKALMSEIEMWLFEHAVNRERSRSGQAVATGLWLWGGGERGALPTSDFAVAGEDALLGAFRAPRKEVRIVIASHAPGSAEWCAMQDPWLAASAAALAGPARLAISIRRRCFEVPARWRWRWFRKTRAWWEYFE